MAEVLTMNETPADQAEFTPEEMDSLKVGEEMVEQQEQLLAGKYKNSEELEKAYVELQKKIGEPKEETSEASKESETEEVTDEKPEEKEEEKKEETQSQILEKLWDEREGGFSDDTLKELSSTNPGELAKEYLRYRQSNQKPQLTEQDVTKLKNVAGGEEQYSRLMDWATKNLSETEQNMFDTVIDRGDPLACFFALQTLMTRYRDTVGSDGKLVSGKSSPSRGDEFRSQAEVVKAMSDPRYDEDPAYRLDVKRKLENSDFEF